MMSQDILSVLHIFIHLVLTKTIQEFYHFHSTDEETEEKG